jgi:hypothetical protein
MDATATPARRYYDNIAALRKGKITPDEYRAANRAMRDEFGEDGYEAAKLKAICFDINANG